MKTNFRVLGAIVLAAGFAFSGYFIYRGIKHYAEKDRCVTVKGLSEREVLANRVTWPMSISLEGNNLEVSLKELTQKRDLVVGFLKDNGIDASEITVASASIYDRWDASDYDKKKPRYSVSLDVTVNTNKVQKVIDLMSQQTDLMTKGVNVTTSDYRVEYDYVDLTSLKPEMVEEATKDARKVAEKFAKDANCDLGSISNATQGQFSVESEYYRPQYKQIRVVTTISYYLR